MDTKNMSDPILDEDSPLIVVEPSSCSNTIKDDCTQTHEDEWWCLWKEEWKQIWALMIPVIATYLLEMLPGIVTIVLVGQIRTSPTDEYDVKDYLDAAALASMMTNVFGLSIGFGLATAMDTLCSQAYGRQQPQSIMILYVQTGMLVLGMAYFGFVLWVHVYASHLLLWMGLPPKVCFLTGQYTRILVPGIPFLYLYELLRKTLQAQNNVRPMLIAALAANIFHVLMGIVLVQSSLGFYGPAVARTLCSLSYPLFLYLALRNKHNHNNNNHSNMIMTRELFSICSKSNNKNDNINNNNISKKLVFQEFLSLGIPGMLQLCLEWWSFEVLALLSGLLKPNTTIEIGVNTIIMNIGSFCYMFYLGIGVSANVRVGNALGAQQYTRANVVCQVSYTYAILTSFLVAAILLLCRSHLPYIFTSDFDIIRECWHSKVLLVAAIFQVFDSMGACVQGILRGSGQQFIGAILCFIAYILIGIPVGIYLAFPLELQVTGLWVGMTFGLFTLSSLGSIHIFILSPPHKRQQQQQQQSQAKPFDTK